MSVPHAIFKLRSFLVVVAISGLAAGLAAWLAGKEAWSAWAWIVGTAPVLAALIAEIFISLRRGDVGLDVVAALSMAAALAFGEPLAGNVVALMYAGGQFLESYAEGRARREMTALLDRVAHTAMRYVESALEEVPIEALASGDRILVRHGEVIPADGNLSSDGALVDESAMTGEGVPVEKHSGEEIPSGATNAGNAFDLTVTRSAAESTYANIVRLVQQAQESKAPSVRIADNFAIWFLLLTLIIAGAAWWISGDRVRALAVLVVATPCPLILALPVAIISGMSRAAKSGVLIKSGGALEMLAKIRTAILDKTGTLTFGQAAISDIKTAEKWKPDEVLCFAASLDQASSHVVADALIADARQRGLVLSAPTEVSEDAGAGISGIVDGHRVVVGGSRFVRAESQKGDPYALRGGVPEGTAVVAVSIDGEVAGIIVLADEVRPDAASMLEAFRSAGIERVVLASGDRKEVVAAVARQLKIDEAFGELTPENKVEIVQRECKNAPTMMLGDGVNDAPALATADVGAAMGARGSAASSEAADVVLLVDRLENLTKALNIAHRTRRIALESVFVGLGLSIVAMIVAAFGYLPPVAGALTQEAIDIAVILNALRALK
ncbi:heavy metal translocating P-type ATPase [Afipia sp. TerB]